MRSSGAPLPRTRGLTARMVFANKPTIQLQKLGKGYGGGKRKQPESNQQTLLDMNPAVLESLVENEEDEFEKMLEAVDAEGSNSNQDGEEEAESEADSEDFVKACEEGLANLQGISATLFPNVELLRC